MGTIFFGGASLNSAALSFTCSKLTLYFRNKINKCQHARLLVSLIFGKHSKAGQDSITNNSQYLAPKRLLKRSVARGTVVTFINIAETLVTTLNAVVTWWNIWWAYPYLRPCPTWIQTQKLVGHKWTKMEGWVPLFRPNLTWDVGTIALSLTRINHYGPQFKLYESSRNYCYAINSWKILHNSNADLLASKTVYNVQNHSDFIPFINTSPILLVQINNGKLLALVDSGCSKCLCSDSAIIQVMPHYKDKLSPYNSPFSDVQGNSLVIMGILPAITITIQNHIFHIDLIIFQSSDLTFLLGFSFIDQYNLSMSSKGLLLPQNHCHTVDTTNTVSIPVRVHTAIYIDALATKIVTSVIDLQKSHLTIAQLKLKHLIASSEPLQPDVPLDELSVYYQYIHISQNGLIDLQYTNFQPSSITLHAGDIIGVIEEMVYPEPINHIRQSPMLNCTLSQHTKSKGLSRKSAAPLIAHPILNNVYNICKYITDIDQLTENEIQDRLSTIEYHTKSQPDIKDTDINVQSQDPNHIQFAKNLVYSHAKLFTAHGLDIGEFNGPPVNLNVKPNVDPIAKPQFPIATKLLEPTRRLIQRFLDMGIVGHSNSPYNSPIFVLAKRKGEKPQHDRGDQVALEQKSTVDGSIKSTDLRLILDCRQINSILSKDYQDFSVPKCMDIIQNIYGMQFIGVFDISNAYFSHNLTPSTAKLFAFTIGHLKLEFRKLVQGCIASPSIFNSLITRLISNAGLTRFINHSDGTFEGCTCYFDNLIVQAKTESTYKQILVKLFDVLLASGYRLKLSKAFFFLIKTFILFGFEISIPDGTIKPEKKKINRILQLGRPATRRSLRNFLGSMGYFHTLIPRLNQILSPLYALSSEKTKFIWSDEASLAYDKAKIALAKSPVIFLSNPLANIYCYTDGAIREHSSYFTFQYSKVHKSLVITSCYSHKLSLAERSFSQYQTELYAIVLYVTKNYHKIQYNRTFLFSDCSALSFLIKFKAENACLLRWWTLINSVNIQVIFCPATNPLLHLSDLLSRSNNALKLMNRRLTEADIKNFPILDFQGLPPLTLQEIELITSRFFLYESQIRQNQFMPNLPKAQRGHCVAHLNSKLGHKALSVNQFGLCNPPPDEVFLTNDFGPSHPTQNKVSPDVGDSSLLRPKSQWSNIHKILQHCHSLFPSFNLLIQSPHYSPSEATTCNITAPTQLPMVPFRSYMINTTNPWPLPAASLTHDHKWAIFPNHMFVANTTTFPFSIMTNHILDVITDRMSLVSVITKSFPEINLAQFVQHQLSDVRLSHIHKALLSGTHLNYVLFHTVLCKTKQVQINQKQVVTYIILCPEKLALQLMSTLHISKMIHLNFSRLKFRVQKHWMIRNFSNLYKEMVQKCTFCALNLPQPHKVLHRALPVFYNLRDTISFDLCVVDRKWTTDAFLNITEMFTTYCVIIPLSSSATAKEIAELIYTRYISIFSPPQFAVKDNGQAMTNTLVDSICMLLHIKPIYTCPYNSRSNNKSEFTNRRVLQCLRMLNQTLSGGLREEYMPIYCAGIATCINAMQLISLQGLSPTVAMTGIAHKPSQFLPHTSHLLPNKVINQYPLYQHYAQLYEFLYQLYEQRSKHFHKNKEITQKPGHPYVVGQFVHVRKAVLTPQHDRKLRPIFLPNIYRILGLTHSTAQLLDVTAQMYFKQRLKGRGALIAPILKRVKINLLKPAPRPQHFLKLSDGRFKSLLSDLDKVQPCKVGFVRPCSDKSVIALHESDKYLKMLLHSPLFGLVPDNAKQKFKTNICNLVKIQTGLSPSYTTGWTTCGLFITQNEHCGATKFIGQPQQGPPKMDQGKYSQPLTGRAHAGLPNIDQGKYSQLLIGHTQPGQPNIFRLFSKAPCFGGHSRKVLPCFEECTRPTTLEGQLKSETSGTWHRHSSLVTGPPNLAVNSDFRFSKYQKRKYVQSQKIKPRRKFAKDIINPYKIFVRPFTEQARPHHDNDNGNNDSKKSSSWLSSSSNLSSSSMKYDIGHSPAQESGFTQFRPDAEWGKHYPQKQFECTVSSLASTYFVPKDDIAPILSEIFDQARHQNDLISSKNSSQSSSSSYSRGPHITSSMRASSFLQISKHDDSHHNGSSTIDSDDKTSYHQLSQIDSDDDVQSSNSTSFHDADSEIDDNLHGHHKAKHDNNHQNKKDDDENYHDLAPIRGEDDHGLVESGSQARGRLIPPLQNSPASVNTNTNTNTETNTNTNTGAIPKIQLKNENANPNTIQIHDTKTKIQKQIKRPKSKATPKTYISNTKNIKKTNPNTITNQTTNTTIDQPTTETSIINDTTTVNTSENKQQAANTNANTNTNTNSLVTAVTKNRKLRYPITVIANRKSSLRTHRKE